MLKEFDAQLQKGDNPGAWTCVVMNDAAELFRTRGLVKIRGAIDGEPFDGALMAQVTARIGCPSRRSSARRSARRRAIPSACASTSGSRSRRAHGPCGAGWLFTSRSRAWPRDRGGSATTEE